jgi:hypothetical protein
MKNLVPILHDFKMLSEDFQSNTKFDPRVQTTRKQKIIVGQPRTQKIIIAQTGVQVTSNN